MVSSYFNDYIDSYLTLFIAFSKFGNFIRGNSPMNREAETTNS